jgi:hypothetical protein
VVGPVRPSDTRLRALRDLAQKTSVQARVGRDVVGLAFTRTASEAQFLAELLEVQKDPYRLSRRRNVVLLYRPAPSGARTAVGACLR